MLLSSSLLLLGLLTLSSSFFLDADMMVAVVEAVVVLRAVPSARARGGLLEKVRGPA